MYQGKITVVLPNNWHFNEDLRPQVEEKLRQFALDLKETIGCPLLTLQTELDGSHATSYHPHPLEAKNS